MFILYAKLKTLKATLKAINRENYSNISARVKTAHKELMKVQSELLARQSNFALVACKKEVVAIYYLLAGMEESVYKQKS